MTLPAEQIEELRGLCESIAIGQEGAVAVLLLGGLRLPASAKPSVVDALLWPRERDGYASRLFFAERIEGAPKKLNWNSEQRIIERRWFAHSWRTQPGMRLVQMVAAHLKAFQ